MPRLFNQRFYVQIHCVQIHMCIPFPLCFSITKKASAVLLQQMPLMYRRIRAHEGPPVPRESLEAAACFSTFVDRLFAASHRIKKQVHNQVPVSAHVRIPSLHPLCGLSESSVS